MNFELHHNCSTGIKFFTDNSQVCFFFMVDLKDVKITKSSDFNRLNIGKSFAVVQLASRESVTIVEGEHIDADTLFSYL